MTEHVFPSQDPHLYPVFSGPGAWYPAEANIRSVPDPAPAPFDPAVFARLAAKSTEHVDHPAPIVTSTWTHENWEEEWYPAPARTLAKKARAAGWEVRIGFSRGYVEGRKANTYAMRDVIGVWLNGYGKRAVVYWERNPDAEFTAKKVEAGIKPGEIPSGYKWSPKGGSIIAGKGVSFPYPNLTEMGEWIALCGAVLPSWYEATQRRAQAEAKTEPQESNEAGATSGTV
jgi:hypothetical protein